MDLKEPKDPKWKDKKDDKSPPQVEHLVEHSPFYAEHKSMVKSLKDNLSNVVYFLFFIAILITLWINLEEGKFPFNVRPLADTAYSKRKWGTPSVAFIIVLVLAMTYLLVRILTLKQVDESIYSVMEGVFKKNNLIVDIKKAKPPPPSNTTSTPEKTLKLTAPRLHKKKK